MRKIQFAENEYYHLYNRGVDKRDIFLTDNDFWRFFISMYLFNDRDYQSLFVSPKNRLIQTQPGYDLGHNLVASKERQPLVDVLCFCLMPNHYHIIVGQRVENGISVFMQKLNHGYTSYFNFKNERTGRLFEGPFKAIVVRKDRYFEHLLRYIHLNPLDLLTSDWRTGGIDDWEKSEQFLKNYKWSSHHVYLGQPQEFQLVNPGVFKDIFRTPKEYLWFLKNWATKEWQGIRDYSLEGKSS